MRKSRSNASFFRSRSGSEEKTLAPNVPDNYGIAKIAAG